MEVVKDDMELVWERRMQRMVDIQAQEWLRPQLKGILFLFFKLDASNQ